MNPNAVDTIHHFSVQSRTEFRLVHVVLVLSQSQGLGWHFNVLCKWVLQLCQHETPVSCSSEPLRGRLPPSLSMALFLGTISMACLCPAWAFVSYVKRDAYGPTNVSGLTDPRFRQPAMRAFPKEKEGHRIERLHRQFRMGQGDDA